MGLCKCRVVTTLFCFQHQVNVCESCLVTDHTKCVVKTYLQWLQDSDFNPTCQLCRDSLNNGSEVIRLTCHDLFHWDCLNKYCQEGFPPHTAPAGYLCPSCQGPVIPLSNVASPVAQQARRFLETAPWASLSKLQRAGSDLSPTRQHGGASSVAGAPLSAASTSSRALGGDGRVVARKQQQPPPPPPHLGGRHHDRGGGSGGGRRGGAEAIDMSALSLDADAGDNKYARRPANQWFARIVGNRMPARKYTDPNAAFKRAAALFVILLIALITLIELLTRARPSAETDPLLNPHLNPNVRISHE